MTTQRAGFAGIATVLAGLVITCGAATHRRGRGAAGTLGDTTAALDGAREPIADPRADAHADPASHAHSDTDP